ncbi:chromodomain-helicase-DNA-binding protein 9-like [Ascaphus truei]|uniref:chromodomain-helicase-DNA-binding protein 9-like n=1 Tax=Ascaphus truei TaxID=8439 RepID=UPI003F59679D
MQQVHKNHCQVHGQVVCKPPLAPCTCGSVDSDLTALCLLMSGRFLPPHSKLIITLGKKPKRKIESSDDVSDTEGTPRALKDEDSQKRRSNRQVKRKKYAEEGEGKQSEDEPKASVKPRKSAARPAEQPLQLFVVGSFYKRVCPS